MKSAYQIKKEPKAKPRNIIDISLGVQTGPCSTPIYIYKVTHKGCDLRDDYTEFV